MLKRAASNCASPPGRLRRTGPPPDRLPARGAPTRGFRRLPGVARGTVQARLDRLQATGVITRLGPHVNPKALATRSSRSPSSRWSRCRGATCSPGWSPCQTCSRRTSPPAPATSPAASRPRTTTTYAPLSHHPGHPRHPAGLDTHLADRGDSLSRRTAARRSRAGRGGLTRHDRCRGPRGASATSVLAGCLRVVFPV